MNQSEEFEIIVSDDIESLKNQLAEIYSKNEILIKELQTKDTEIDQLNQQISAYKNQDTKDQYSKNTKSKDQQNEIEMYQLTLKQQNQEIEKLKKDLQSLQQQNLTKENASVRNIYYFLSFLKQLEKVNAQLRLENNKLYQEVKSLQDKLNASELKVKQQMNSLKEKEETLNQIFKDIEKQKNIEIQEKIKQFQKQKDQEIEILKTTQKKIIAQYEKKLIDKKQMSQVFFNDQNKLNPMQTIFTEIEGLINKHIDDIEGRRQVIDFIDQKTNIKDLYKKDLEEVQNSLVQINNFLKNNS